MYYGIVLSISFLIKPPPSNMLTPLHTGRCTQVITRAPQRTGRASAKINLIQRRHAHRVTDLGTVQPVSTPGQCKHRNGDVAGEKVRHAEAAQERLEPIEEQNQDEHENARVRHVRLAVPPQRQVAAVNPLGVEGALEAHVAEADTCPGNERAERRQVRQPGESLVGAVRHRQESEQAEAHRDDDTDVRGADAACLEEDGGHGALASERHHGAGQAVGVFVARGQGGGHNDGVDDGGEHGDTGLLANDDEGGGCGGVAALADGGEELRGVLGDVEADDEDGGYVETDDAVEDGLGGGLHGFAGVVGFAGDNTDGLDTAVGNWGESMLVMLRD